MKLTKELKKRIDNYFDNISAEELLNITVNKYDFCEVNIEIENQKFDSVVKSFYNSKSNSGVYDEGKDYCDYSIAA